MWSSQKYKTKKCRRINDSRAARNKPKTVDKQTAAAQKYQVSLNKLTRI
jgi:hypothetical protein